MTDTTNPLCQQRRLAQLYNIPITRLELKTPYGGPHSKFDLDMRRKAEVLKYANNASNTKTNNLTKRERLALLSRGNSRLNPATIKSEEAANCPNSASILTSTTASDVPGPPMLLYDDESIPLYNYSTNTDSYGNLPPTVLSNYYIVPVVNAPFTNDVSGQVFPLIFRNTADYQNINMTINIPIGLSISGILLTSGSPITFSVTSAKLAQYYNSTLVRANTYSGPTLSMTVDLNGTGVGQEFFVTNRYIGNVLFSGWPVYSAPGYVYQWYAAIHVSYSQGGATINSGAIIQTIVGIGADAVFDTSNCSVTASSTGVNGGIMVTVQ